MKIGELSKLSQTTIKTIRYYDKIGLLKPTYIDPKTSYRYYNEEALAVMNQINIYKKCGFKAKEISGLLYKNKDRKDSILLEKIENLKSEMKNIKSTIEQLEAYVLGDQLSKYTAEIKHIDTKNVFSCRGYVQSPTETAEFMHEMIEKFKKAYPNITFPEDEYCCIIYPESAYRENNLIIEFNQEINGKEEDKPPFEFKKLKSVKVISVYHIGDYSSLREAYLYAVLWAKEHNYSFSAQARERYLRGPWNCRNQDEWLTEIQLPIVSSEE